MNRTSPLPLKRCLALIPSLVLTACIQQPSVIPLPDSPHPGSQSPIPAPPTASVARSLHATVLFPVGVLPKLKQGLRIQTGVDPKDLAVADLKQLVITVNGQVVAAEAIDWGALQWDATGRITLSLTLRQLAVPSPWRIQVATKTHSLILISHQAQRRDEGSETHLLSAPSTAAAMLRDKLDAAGKRDTPVSQAAIDLLAQRLESAFTSSDAGNPLERSTVADAIQKLTDAIGRGVPDSQLKPVLDPPHGGGGGQAAIAPAPTIASISPNRGSVTLPTAITVTGTGFATGVTVTVGGVAATGVVVVNATTVTATVPAGLPLGVTDVVVTNPDTQSATAAGAYTVDPPGIDVGATIKNGLPYVGTPVGADDTPGV